MFTTSLTEPFRGLPDPRSRHGRRYPLDALVTIAVCAALCGAEDWSVVAAFGHAKAEWFGAFLDLREGTPSHDTFDRVFARLDPEAFERCFRVWTAGLGELSGMVSVDGQDAAAELRSGRGQGRHPHGQRVGVRARPGLRAAGGGREEQRDHGHPHAARAAGPQGADRND